MSHLVILPIQHFPTHRLAEYEVTTTAMTEAAKRAAASENPQLELKRHLCSFYCFDPRITPEDIIEFKLHTSNSADRILVHLHLKLK